MRHSLLLLAAIAFTPLVGGAQTPAGEQQTRALMQTLCTELSMPCNSCGGHRADPNAGPPPTPRPANDLLRKPVDGWGRNMQISVGGEGVTLRSAGADGELGTADDLVQSCGEPAK